MALFENFPYTDLHNLNLDWIVKIAKDFLDQYTSLQQMITDGETSLTNLTNDGLASLQEKADNLESALQSWYDEHSEDIADQLADALADLNAWYLEHSEDIADQLADALADLNAWYTEHQGYLDQYLEDSVEEFEERADAKAATTIASIPADYTELSEETLAIKQALKFHANKYFADEPIDILCETVPYNTLEEGYINVQSDTVVENSAWRHSDYIDIQNVYGVYQKFYNNGSRVDHCMVVYDENKIMLFGCTGEEQNIVFPADAKYIRYNLIASELNGINTETHYIKIVKGKYENTVINNSIIPADFKKTIQNTLGTFPQSEYNDGFYVRNNGGIGVGNQFSVQTTPITYGSKYRIRTYASIDSESVTGVIIGIADQVLGVIGNYTTPVPNTQRDYIVTPPIGSVKMLINIYKTEKYPVWEYYNEETGAGLPTWLKTIYSQEIDTNHNATVINKPFTFTPGKKVVVFGDSIAAGVGANPSGDGKPWVNQFEDKTGLSLVQQAISGSCLAYESASRPVCITDKVLAYNGSAANIDLIIIAGGTNDYTRGIALGTPTSTDKTNIYGALNTICSTLKTNYPNVPVLFITPINRPYSANNKSQITYLNKIRNAIFETAIINGYSVVDGSKMGFPMEPGYYQSIVIADGLHPSPAGHTLYANYLCGILL